MAIENGYTLLFEGLVKYDNLTGESTSVRFGEGRWGSESPFAPRPGSTKEDDGYLVSFVYDAVEDHSEVVVLDAADISAGPVCRVLIPQRVPHGFHACWVPQERMKRG